MVSFSEECYEEMKKLLKHITQNLLMQALLFKDSTEKLDELNKILGED